MKLEIRDNALHISGYVNAVERESRRLPKRMSAAAMSDFTEKISAGVFAKALKKASEVRLMFNHRRDIGGTADGTLTLAEDNIGLRAEAVITDSEVISAAKRGELRGWSFGFSNAVDRWEETSDGLQRRTILGLDLHEVSILSVEPAYAGTSVEVRCGTDDLPTTIEVEMRTAEDIGKLADVPVEPDTRDEPDARDAARKAVEFYKYELEVLKMKGELL